jgi:hypothetical protein
MYLILSGQCAVAAVEHTRFTKFFGLYLLSVNLSIGFTSYFDHSCNREISICICTLFS